MHQYSRLELVEFQVISRSSPPHQLIGSTLNKTIFMYSCENSIDTDVALPVPIFHACSLSHHPWVPSVISDTLSSKGTTALLETSI